MRVAGEGDNLRVAVENLAQRGTAGASVGGVDRVLRVEVGGEEDRLRRVARDGGVEVRHEACAVLGVVGVVVVGREGDEVVAADDLADDGFVGFAEGGVEVAAAVVLRAARIVRPVVVVAEARHLDGLVVAEVLAAEPHVVERGGVVVAVVAEVAGVQDHVRPHRGQDLKGPLQVVHAPVGGVVVALHVAYDGDFEDGLFGNTHAEKLLDARSL